MHPNPVLTEPASDTAWGVRPDADSPASPDTATQLGPHTSGKASRLLSIGFTVSMLILLLAGASCFHSLDTIRELLSRQRVEQDLSAQLTDQIHNHLATLGAVLHAVFRASDSREAQQVLNHLDRFQTDLTTIVESGLRTREREHWERLRTVGLEFSEEVRTFFSLPPARRRANRLFDLHDALIEENSRLLHARYLNSAQARTQIASAANSLVQRTVLLMIAAALLAMICAVYTVRNTYRLIRQVEIQSSDLNKVTWQLVNSQETASRRFAHELHDALGQNLAALRSNLVALRRNANGDARRLIDSLALVDETIASTRELAHLMRPSILDDFGLSASLEWIAEKFSNRSEIQAEYVNNFSGRLEESAEAHLFRIAQEALTNVSRHSQATHVTLRLWRDEPAKLRLSIHDNGIGWPATSISRNSSLGLNGMRARARMLGGDLELGGSPGGGAAVNVWIPFSGELQSYGP